MEGKRPRGVKSMSLSTSLGHCAMLCFSDKSCNILSYNKTTGSCTGFSRVVIGNDDQNNTHVIEPDIYHRGKVLS